MGICRQTERHRKSICAGSQDVHQSRPQHGRRRRSRVADGRRGHRLVGQAAVRPEVPGEGAGRAAGLVLHRSGQAGAVTAGLAHAGAMPAIALACSFCLGSFHAHHPAPRPAP